MTLFFFADSSFNQQERLDIEEKYTSLREEAQGKSKKLKKLEGSVKNLESDVSKNLKVLPRETLANPVRRMRG